MTEIAKTPTERAGVLGLEAQREGIAVVRPRWNDQEDPRDRGRGLEARTVVQTSHMSERGLVHSPAEPLRHRVKGV